MIDVRNDGHVADVLGVVHELTELFHSESARSSISAGFVAPTDRSMLDVLILKGPTYCTILTVLDVKS